MSYERTVEQYENYIELLENWEEYTDENDKNLYENILDFWVNNYDNEYQCDLYVYVDRIERDENKKITFRTECFENVGGNSHLDDDHFRFMKTGGTGHSTIIDEIPDFVIAFKETFPDKKVPDTNEYGDEMNESEQAEYIRLSYPEQFHSFENECLRESDTVREWINLLIDEEKEEMIYQLAETIRAEESVQFIENIRMFNARQNWVNAKPFSNTDYFSGVQQYRIAAECNGYVLGVTEKGNCAVWSGSYSKNGELREVSGGSYFTGVEFGASPEKCFESAFALFAERASGGKVADKEETRAETLAELRENTDYDERFEKELKKAMLPKRDDVDLQKEIEVMVSRFFLNDAKEVYSDNHEWRIASGGNGFVGEIYYDNKPACQIEDTISGYKVTPTYAEVQYVANYTANALKNLDFEVELNFKYDDDELDLTQQDEHRGR